jgi:glutaminase
MASPLSTLSAEQLANIAIAAQPQVAQGRVNSRIPLLAQADSRCFGVHIEQPIGPSLQWGETHRPFPLMSVIKPYLLLYLLQQHGMDQVFQWVGMTPSESSFNSLAQLKADQGWPRNPMINSGALVLSSHLPGQTGAECCEHLRHWLTQQANCQLWLDETLLGSVRQAGREPNHALIQYLTETEHLRAPDRTLDIYEHICCLSCQLTDLARLGRLLAFPSTAVNHRHRCAVNALMLTCGLYEASPDYAVRVGLPMKSGISGALLAIVPNQAVIATYSPALDTQGNPTAGLAFIEHLAADVSLSLFG